MTWERNTLQELVERFIDDLTPFVRSKKPLGNLGVNEIESGEFMSPELVESIVTMLLQERYSPLFQKLFSTQNFRQVSQKGITKLDSDLRIYADRSRNKIPEVNQFISGYSKQSYNEAWERNLPPLSMKGFPEAIAYLFLSGLRFQNVPLAHHEQAAGLADTTFALGRYHESIDPQGNAALGFYGVSNHYAMIYFETEGAKSARAALRLAEQVTYCRCMRSLTMQYEQEKAALLDELSRIKKSIPSDHKLQDSITYLSERI
ncbi:MAG: hypothetical protein ABIJ34_05825 [archaeon]